MARPLIVWGMDPVARAVAENFLKPGAEDPPRMFVPGAEPLRDFRNLVVAVHEEARGRHPGTEPAVCLFAASFALTNARIGNAISVPTTASRTMIACSIGTSSQAS